MNKIRLANGWDLVECASDEDILAAADSFKILIGMMHETFDPWQYNQDGGL